jgi:hypothetical protein
MQLSDLATDTADIVVKSCHASSIVRLVRNCCPMC